MQARVRALALALAVVPAPLAAQDQAAVYRAVSEKLVQTLTGAPRFQASAIFLEPFVTRLANVPPVSDDDRIPLPDSVVDELVRRGPFAGVCSPDADDRCEPGPAGLTTVRFTTIRWQGDSLARVVARVVHSGGDERMTMGSRAGFQVGFVARRTLVRAREGDSQDVVWVVSDPMPIPDPNARR